MRKSSRFGSFSLHVRTRGPLARPQSSSVLTARGFAISSRCNSGDGGNLTHTDEAGKASMVDVGHKPVTTRTAVAEAWITLGERAFSLVEENKMKKGDVLTVAQLAGICGSKHTSLLIPLCHPIPITHAKVTLELVREKFAVHITTQVSTCGQTGVEMEALTAASVAALTVYDMCKAVTHDMTITSIALVQKTGGQRGDYTRDGAR